MPLVLIFVALILIAVAWQNNVTNFASALSSDASGFAKWFAALAIVGGLQWVPGMERPARWLLGLVLLVLVVKNYTNIFKGFADIASGTSTASTATTSPTQAYLANPTNPQITSAEVQGGSSSSSGSSTVSSVASAVTNYDPSTFLASYKSDLSSMGFGGIA
jgi:hypothetical protein